MPTIEFFPFKAMNEHLSVGKILVAVHGFLGQPSDWELLFKKARAFNLECQAVDLQQDYSEIRKGDFFNLWADSFAARIQGRPILLGYSMGGRLAMHALIRHPHRFSGAILISSNPGLSVDAISERSARIDRDEKWALRLDAIAHSLEGEAWESFLEDWNQQSVFLGGTENFQRRKEDYNPSILAGQMRSWSLGNQRDLLPELSDLEIPILWIVGEQDSKYLALSQSFEKARAPHSDTQVWRVPEAGHRVPWEQPELFSERVLHWIFERSLGRFDGRRENRE